MKGLLILIILLVSCSKSQEEVVSSDMVLPEINSDTKTEITVWAWDVAAMGLRDTVASFNAKYPDIKVTVVDIGYSGNNEKYSVVLRSGEGMPDIFMIEGLNATKYAENFPHRLLDMKNMFYEDWTDDMAPSQVADSTDTEGRIIAVPWDTGPVVMFYREEFFRKADVDPASIVDWNDFIEAGIKVQAALPNIKMIGFPHTRQQAFSWGNMRISANDFTLNSDSEIAINSDVSIQALELVRQMVRKDKIVHDTLNWDGLVRAAVDESVATFVTGGWWVGTLLDQAPEQSGKWRIMEMPAMPGYEGRAAVQGGSVLLVSAQDLVKKVASIAFIENALLNADNQIMMYDSYGLIPSYLPVYEDARMKTGSKYFGGQDINGVFSKVIANIPPDTSHTLESAIIGPLEMAAFEYATTTDEDIKEVLDDTALQIEQATTHERAYK